jgi:uncharacterized protein (TIGR03067 family)
MNTAFSVFMFLNLGFAPAPDEKDSMDGTWIAISGEEKGKEITQKEFEKDQETLEIKGKSLKWKRRTETIDLTFKLSPKARPAGIDLIYPGDKGTNHAIYSLKEDKLVICFSSKMNPNTADERPIAFTTNRKENNDLRGLNMIKFERKK